MLRAWILGLVLLLAAAMIWSLTLWVGVYSQFAVLTLWASPFAAAMLVAWSAPRHQILLGLSMAVPTALLAVSLNFAVPLFGGDVDFPGIMGHLILFGIVGSGAAVLALLGAVMGRLVRSP